MSAATAQPGTIPAFVNPLAGDAKAAAAAVASNALLELREVAPDDLGDALRAAAAGGARRVVVAGGDGSIASAAMAAAGTSLELAVLPAGTLNHFAKDLGIPLDLGEAARLASNGTVIGADVAYVNGRLFLNTSSVGAYVTFVRTRERLEPRWGYLPASMLAVARLSLHLRTFSVELEVEGQVRRYVTPLVFIGLGERELKLPTLGNRVENGRHGLHVMVVRGRTRARLMTIAFAAAARGLHTISRTPLMDSFLVNRCRIEMRRPRGNVAVDGEIVTMIAPLEYRIAREALRVVVPRSGE
jgi:diacylglycerol kinase family enzyme